MMTLQSAFLAQAISCIALGSPFMGRLMRLLAQYWPENTGVARRFAASPGDISSMGASLPLRIAGGLHALVLNRQDARLAAAYPPHDVDDATLLTEVQRALQQYDAFLCNWIENAPQTNEARRSAVLIVATCANVRAVTIFEIDAARNKLCSVA